MDPYLFLYLHGRRTLPLGPLPTPKALSESLVYCLFSPLLSRRPFWVVSAPLPPGLMPPALVAAQKGRALPFDLKPNDTESATCTGMNFIASLHGPGMGAIQG